MKLARDCAGDVVLLTISYVSLWVRQSTGDVVMCPPGKPVSLANATAVAAVGDKDECASHGATKRGLAAHPVCSGMMRSRHHRALICTHAVPWRLFNDARLLPRRGREAGLVALASLNTAQCCESYIQNIKTPKAATTQIF